MNKNAGFKRNTTKNPRRIIISSIAGKGIAAFVFPPLRIPNSTKRINAETMKQILQINTILEKKRKYIIMNDEL